MTKRNGKASFSLWPEGHDPIAANRLASALLTFNDYAGTRRSLTGASGDDRRDINDECGYPRDGELTIEHYWRIFDRSSVARRVVNVLPRETFQVAFSIYEAEDEGTETEFEKSLKMLDRVLAGRGSASWYEEQGNELCGLTDLARRIDEASGIGSFGVVYFGFNDVKDREGARKPVAGFIEENSMPGGEGDVAGGVGAYNLTVNAEGEEGFDPAKSKVNGRKLLFARAFSQASARITRWETNPTSDRMGKPVAYSIDLAREGKEGEPQSTVEVHWTRIVHIPSDDAVDNECFGTPRLHVAYNRIYDIEKIQGADGEGFYRGGLLKYFFETHPELGGDVEVDKAAFRDEWEEFQNSFQNAFVTKGMSAKAVPPAVADPTPHIKAKIDDICMLIGVPVPVFLGYEIGEQASEENKIAWKERIAHRQRYRGTFGIILPLVDRLIQVGVLPKPVRYRVEWADMNSLSEEQGAKLAGLWTDVLTKALAGGLFDSGLFQPLDFYTAIMRMTADEAKAILAKGIKWVEFGAWAEAQEDEKYETEDEWPEEPPPGADEIGLRVGEMPGQGGAPPGGPPGAPGENPFAAGGKMDEDGNPVDDEGNPVLEDEDALPSS